MRLNACELEIDLFCKGIRVPAEVRLDGSRSISRTRAGLGSGLEIVIPAASRLKDRVWVNVPVEERFARQSPYVLDGSPEGGTRSATSATARRTRSRSRASRPGIRARPRAASR